MGRNKKHKSQANIGVDLLEKYINNTKEVRKDKTHKWYFVSPLRMTIKLKREVKINTWLADYIHYKFNHYKDRTEKNKDKQKRTKE